MLNFLPPGCSENVNARVRIGNKNILVKDVATKVGKVVDTFTGGETDFESLGRGIDELTKNVTIGDGDNE